jgi:hypothetical protein
MRVSLFIEALRVDGAGFMRTTQSHAPLKAQSGARQAGCNLTALYEEKSR